MGGCFSLRDKTVIDLLRDKLCNRQEIRGVAICPVCLHGMYGDSAIHHAIIKRGDLPNDTRIDHEYNCVAIHNMCHENKRSVDERCGAYLVSHYGAKAIADWIDGLGLDYIPARAMRIMNQGT